ncbi:DUF58 domain-containing protein [Halorarum halophilum]|uniref:DUF58 domain-containing protein n=1 Tax=Halorarum halophilum TaxID=2743090 RepID=A0A7D5KLD5_9EURY|nr:DUF58 domain-containing protein [Halobaculum halophilum]QLG27435.1 DUF58 domain-containing protein [Halobaculum halophilum]
MRATRRTWTVTAAGLVVLLLGVVSERPLLLFAGAAVGAWLLSRQYAAYHSIRAVHSDLSVDVRPIEYHVLIEQDVRVTATVRLANPAPAPVRLSFPVPVAAVATAEDARTVDVPRGETAAATTFAWSFPTAGRYTVPPATVTVTDTDGLFAETFERGEPVTLHVDAREPQDVTVGRGGEKVASRYGEHPAGRSGTGLTPAELRQYLPGDALDRIDWKATARLHTPYVREFEAETDRQIVMVVDHRSRMTAGQPGETAFEYAREVALGFTATTEAAADPLGCWTVGDDGVTGQISPVTGAAGYAGIRDRLRQLSPTGSPALPTTDSPPGSGVLRPTVARERATRLDGDSSLFATRLSPFFEAADPYIQRLAGDPLNETIRRVRVDVRGTTWLVILTDDTDRDRLREAVRLATNDGGFALVFLTPQVLFEERGLDDIEAAYARYVDFEEFRRELDRLPRVTAFEVGPGDRLDALLAARRRAQ